MAFSLKCVVLKRLAVITLTMLTTVCFSSEICTSGWTWGKFSGTCIKYFDDSPKSWTDARKECGKHQADLVVIPNEEHNEFLHDMVRSFDDPIWIGLNDLKEQLNYRWLDSNEKVQYVNWKEGQPNELDHHCVQINNRFGKSNREWTDDECSVTERFLCERIQDTTGKCPAGWVWSPKSGTCMKVFDDKMSWHSAKEHCIKNGAELLTILNEDTNNFLQEYLDPIETTNDYFWIGLNDLADTGTYRWLDYADKVTYTKWATNSIFKGSKCAAVKNPQEGWEMADCTQEKKFICEKISENCHQHDEALCPQNCSTFCENNACNKKSGVCSFGCVSGYLQPQCNEKCTGNTYGKDCNKTCNPNCGGLDKACNFSNGYCLHGCFGDFSGLFCSNYTPYRASGRGQNNNNLTAGIFLALLLTAFILLFFAMKTAAKLNTWQEGEQLKSTQPRPEENVIVEEMVDDFADARQISSRSLHETFDGENEEHFENENQLDPDF